MDKVRGCLQQAILDVCGIHGDQLALSATLQELNIDSLDMVEIAMIVEQEFSIVIDTESFRDCATYGDVLTVFRSLTSQ